MPVAAVAGQTVTVFAAASLREALDEVAELYEGEVVLSYGGSGQIARQVAQGAPADVVILANTAWMDWLVENALVAADNRFDLLGNRLVLAGPSGAEPLVDIGAETLLARLADGRLAIGQTQSVPAGIYARQWLEKTGLWPELAAHLAETENVRAALALIARGEVPLGVVYVTDVRADGGVVTLHEIPDDLHDPIRYPAAILNERNAAQAAGFVSVLRSSQAMDVFTRHGFLDLAAAQ